MIPRYQKALCAVLPLAGLLWAAPMVTAYDDSSGRYGRSDRYSGENRYNPSGEDRYNPSGEDRYDREDRYGRQQPSVSARMSERDLRSFENYLDTHDETARTLYQNPELINDRRYVRNNQSLNDWIANHPDAADTLRANPNKFLWRERTTNAGDFLNQLLGSRR